MRARRLVVAVTALWLCGVASSEAAETEIRYLTGQGHEDAVAWDFLCTAGRGCGQWTKIRVPSCWELQGFGTYNYGHDAQKATERGHYRTSFEVPPGWKSRKVAIVFEGAMTDTEVRLNGELAGPVHQGGFVRFEYDVTRLLRFGGKNLLEVTVSKVSADDSVNFAERCADYWVFGGIYRPVYLKAVPRESIRHLAIDARADGTLRIEAALDGLRGAGTVVARVEALDGSTFGSAVRVPVRPAQARTQLEMRVASPLLWSAESPYLYQAVVTLEAGGLERHLVRERFGFRTVEVRAGDGIYVNGRKVRLQGVNRHSFWPTSGRTTSPSRSRSDVLLMKDMNMNAVRMSHYPPDGHFLDTCDELGLYVIDELPGWQAPPYATAVGRTILREMVLRDRNHPSILLWANGNEGGWNPELQDEFRNADLQGRAVLRPGATASGVHCEHYPDFAALRKGLSGDLIYLPTEFLHGLYDGGLGAGLQDYWDLMVKSPRSAGGFLWAFVDEAVVRTDRNGALDAAGNYAPDGILGPYREKEGSFLTIKEIWAPIQVTPPKLVEGFDGRLSIENRYQFTNADRCAFDVKLLRFKGPWAAGGAHGVLREIRPASPSVPPGETGSLAVPLPADWRESDALSLTARDPDGRELNTWTWMIKKPAEILAGLAERASGAGPAVGRDAGDRIVLSARGVEVAISKVQGTLVGVSSGGRTVSLGGGPILVGKNVAGWLRDLTHGPEGDAYVVRARFGGNLKQITWRMDPSGWLRLHWDFWLADREGQADHDYYGVSFDYPEAQVTGVRWLGRGPYRVYKNRTRGARFDVWEKAANRTETGTSWDYPEFKGYHGPFYWAMIRNREQDFVVATETENLFLRLFTPKFENAGGATAAFPPGDISFLHGIAPIGMKFIAAGGLGPASQRHRAVGDFSGAIAFHFGEPPPSGSR